MAILQLRVAHVATVDLSVRFLLLPQLRALQESGFDVTAVSAAGRWVPEIEAGGVRHVTWPQATRSIRPQSDLSGLVWLTRRLAKERISLLHTHTPKAGVIGRLAGRWAGIPCIVNTVHGFYATPEDPKFTKWIVLTVERMAAWFSDLELFQSEEDLEWAIEKRVVKPHKAILLGNGVDLTEFTDDRVSAERLVQLRAELSLGDNLVVGMIGRLTIEKGYAEFLEAAHRISAQRSDVRFLVVGEPDGRASDPIGSCGPVREENIILTGWREDVRDLLALMDVFVLPSWREGLPRSAIEAAAMGRASVLTNIRGCREVGRNNIEALLVPPKDAVSLSEAITFLLEHPHERRRLGAAARDRAVKRFDENDVIDRLLSAYKTVLTNKGLLAEFHNGVAIRRARAEDAPSIGSLHATEMQEAYLPRLGPRFLTRLYKALTGYPDAVVLVAEDRDELVAFCVGVRSVRRFYKRFFLRHGVPALIGALPRLLLPSVLRGAIQTGRYPSMRAAADAELLSLATKRTHTRRGIGRALAVRLLRDLGGLSISRVKVVVAADNHAANRLYNDVGFRRESEITLHGDQISNVWVAECPSS